MSQVLESRGAQAGFSGMPVVVADKELVRQRPPTRRDEKALPYTGVCGSAWLCLGSVVRHLSGHYSKAGL